MKLQRYDLAGDYGDDHVPMEHGNWCASDDVRKLEQSHTELLEALKEIIEQTDGRNNSVMGQDRAYSIARAAIANAERASE